MKRFLGYLLPPVGLIILWRGTGKLGKKLLGSIGLLIYSLLYAGLIIFLLIKFTGLQIEWRGGYAPALTYRKTRPDYERLERDRASRPEKSFPLSTTIATNDVSWPQFRGPKGDGSANAELISTNWPTQGLALLWRQPIGGGYGSFAEAEGLLFTIEQRREQEALVAYSIESGRETWAHAWPGEFHDYYSETGPRATPGYSEGKIYALGAMGTFTCVESQTGKSIWSHEIVAENHGNVPTFGLASSPLILREKVIVLSSAGNGHSVLCYDKNGGKLIWSVLDDMTGYASPMAVSLAGEEVILVCCENRTVGLRPDDGKLLWEYGWHVKNKQLPIAQPVILGTNCFFLSAGYFTGCAAAEVTKSNDTFQTRTLWQNSYMKNKFTSSVFYDGYIYGLDEDILTCLDATTGERKWKDGRYGYGQIILSHGLLVVLAGDGQVCLVKATPEKHEELARFQAIQGKTWNHPALVRGRLIVRNAEEMAAFQIGPESR